MGKYLDTAFFSSFGFFVMFILLSFTDKDIRIVGLVSALISVSLGVIVFYLLERYRKRKTKRKKSEAVRFVKSLIYKDQKEANESAFEILKDRYNLLKTEAYTTLCTFKEGIGEEVNGLYVIRKFKASPDDILTVWREEKKKGMVSNILFIVPGKADPDIRGMSCKLSSPGVRIAEKSFIKSMYRKYGKKEEYKSTEKKFSPFKTIRMYINKKRAFRYLLYALLLVVYYLLTGSLIYFLMGGALMMISCAGFTSEVNGETLFH